MNKVDCKLGSRTRSYGWWIASWNWQMLDAHVQVGGWLSNYLLVLSQGWAFNSNEWTSDSIKEKCRHQEIKKSGGEIIQELMWAGWSNWPAMNGRSHKTGEKFSWTWLGLFGAWHEGRHARPHVGGGWVAPAGVVQVHMGGAQLHMGGAHPPPMHQHLHQLHSTNAMQRYAVHHIITSATNDWRL